MFDRALVTPQRCPLTKKQFRKMMVCHILANTKANETNLMNDMDMDKQSCRTVIRTKVIMKMGSDMAKAFTGKSCTIIPFHHSLSIFHHKKTRESWQAKRAASSSLAAHSPRSTIKEKHEQIEGCEQSTSVNFSGQSLPQSFPLKLSENTRMGCKYYLNKCIIHCVFLRWDTSGNLYSTLLW